MYLMTGRGVVVVVLGVGGGVGFGGKTSLGTM